MDNLDCEFQTGNCHAFALEACRRYGLTPVAFMDDDDIHEQSTVTFLHVVAVDDDGWAIDSTGSARLSDMFDRWRQMAVGVRAVPLTVEQLEASGRTGGLMRRLFEPTTARARECLDFLEANGTLPASWTAAAQCPGLS